MQPYEFKEFPKMVYGPAGEQTIIATEDGRPDGFLDHPDEFNDIAAAAVEQAEADAKRAADDERATLRAFLDEHKVEYSVNLGTVRLRALADQLKDHLEKQNGAGQ